MTVATETSSPPIAPALKVLAEMSPVREGDIIPLLQRLQNEYGYLPRDVILEVARQTGLPTSRIYGVATFYAQFYLKPHGRHTIRCCRGTACHVRGGKKVIDAARRTLGIDDGETTEDMQFSLETVACLGACALSPVIVVDGRYCGKVTPRRAEEILRRMVREGA